MLKFKLSDRIIVKEVELPQGKKDINDLSKEEFDACMQKALNSSIETSYNIKNKATLLRDKIKKYNLKKENF
jgi:hypothetical protein